MAMYAKMVFPAILVLLAAIAYVVLAPKLWDVMETLTAAMM